MKKTYLYFAGLALLTVSISCKKDKEEAIECTTTEKEATVPEFFGSNPIGSAGPDYTTFATRTDFVNKPQDLDFHPSRTGELWILNEGVPSTGSTTIIISDAGKGSQSSVFRKDGNSWHFMSMGTALAFSPENNNFGTSSGIFDANQDGGNPFAGPSLWSSDMSIYAQNAGPGTNGSHLDMLHESPYSMGIAHEKDNIFWVFDGNSSQIVKYDFKADHGPGMHDHSDAEVERYIGMTVSRNANVPSHMVIDKSNDWMYICDTGNGRILRMRINTGTKNRDLPRLYEPLASRKEMHNHEWEVFTDVNLTDPCGVDVIDGRLFVSDNATNEIIAYNTSSKKEMARIQTNATSIKGVEIGPEGKLWYVDYAGNTVVRVDPK